jgi:hypothetical protein
MGMLTFSVPMLVGFTCAYYFVRFWVSGLHTCLVFDFFAIILWWPIPIVRRLGVLRNEAVTVVMGSTLITDTLALLILAHLFQKRSKIV